MRLCGTPDALCGDGSLCGERGEARKYWYFLVACAGVAASPIASFVSGTTVRMEDSSNVSKKYLCTAMLAALIELRIMGDHGAARYVTMIENALLVNHSR